MPRPTRCLPALVCLLVLTACRIDVTVGLTLEENGSGEVAVTIVADRELVAAAPGLAADVRTDDLTAAGWRTEGAVATADGGLSLTLAHPFDTPEQATALLSSLNGPGGPLQAILVERTASLRGVAFTVRGSGRVDAGLDAFADADLLASVGGTPYAAQIAATGGSPADAVAVRLVVDLPGEVGVTSGTFADSADGASQDRSVVAWDLPLDGTTLPIDLTSVRSLERGGGWPILANGLFVILVAWVLASLVLIVSVIRSQRRRHRAAERLGSFDRFERNGRL